MFCEHCGETDGEETGIDHDERDCPWYATEDSWTADDLEGVLRQTASGIPPLTAAVELLSTHGTWLPRLAERDDLMVADGETGEVYDLDWAALAEAANGSQLAASGSELRILAIAASLADSRVPVRLGDALTGLDAINLGRVLKAIATANGRPEAGERHV
ncbi:hypothetical protein GCM10011579_060000 [Streptomyces albiflavescens]|uniref:Uncharacterized protein n=2 Tax=Streptomyces albiflavescens TaxID=1623582 RepID=A0A918D7Q7_9ACTN|nr:hypothetical protein GCM10011579_060000 [Streptomyces albiflavescens]